jgi:hypothetical protein
LKNKKQEGEDDEEEVKYKRVWYAPWKKVKVGGASFKVGDPLEPIRLTID